jgi:uncharacterized protein DUF6812
MEQRRQRVLVETSKHRITGVVTMPAGGFRSRLSDFLNQSEREFIALTDAVVAPLNGNGPLEPRDFVVVGRSHIVLAMPESGGGDDADAD